MEEKIIDPEDDVIRIKRKADAEAEEGTEEDEFVFDVTEPEEDDEELASLTPEEAEAFKKARAEKQREIEEKGRALLAEADAHLAAGEFDAAAEAYFGAREYLGAEPEVCIGILRCGTRDFTATEGLEDLREMLDGLRIAPPEVREAFLAAHKAQIEATLSEIRAKRDPLAQKVEAARARRGEVFSRDYRKAKKGLLIVAPFPIVFFAAAIALFLSIYSSAGPGILLTAIVCTVLFAASLVAALVLFHRYVNAKNRVHMNADNAYSNDGRQLNALEEQAEFYGALDELL